MDIKIRAVHLRSLVNTYLEGVSTVNNRKQYNMYLCSFLSIGLILKGRLEKDRIHFEFREILQLSSGHVCGFRAVDTFSVIAGLSRWR